MKPIIQKALDTWAEEARLPGDFLQAVLRGDLYEAVFRADSDNLGDLPEICRYVYNVLPGSCWGSQEHLEAWQARDPAERREAARGCRERHLETKPLWAIPKPGELGALIHPEKPNKVEVLEVSQDVYSHLLGKPVDREHDVERMKEVEESAVPGIGRVWLVPDQHDRFEVWKATWDSSD